MARARDLALLAHGVRMWNATAAAPGRGRPDLSGASLVRSRLDRIDLRGADLTNADLRSVRLRYANLTDAVLDGANLSGAVLDDVTARSASMKEVRLHHASASRAILEKVEFADSNLSDASFANAQLTGAIFRGTDLSRTHFTGANLRHCVFYYGIMEETRLRNADLQGAYFGGMTLNDVNFSMTKGLRSITHRAPSFVSVGTVRLNAAPEAREFLRKCGINEVESAFGKIWARNVSESDVHDIMYEVVQLRTMKPIMFSSLFVSYSHGDADFVDRLVAALESAGLQCWRDVKKMTVGRIDTQIDRAIRLNPTVLLVLSTASVRSDWVAWEAAAARRVEREAGRSVLCPIALDDAWKTCDWPAPLRNQIEAHHILDFSKWGDAEPFRAQFRRLLQGLQLYYGRS